MDVVNAEQARIAEEAGACAVMALERVPADIRAFGGAMLSSTVHASGRKCVNFLV
jgi:pyridoxal biosynthesis lyase PdxS